MDIKTYSFKIQLIDLSLMSMFKLFAFETGDEWVIELSKDIK